MTMTVQQWHQSTPLHATATNTSTPIRMLVSSVVESFVKRSMTVRALLVRRASKSTASTSAKSTPPIRNVLIYDGVCNLCNAGVRFVLPRTPSSLKFCAVQTRMGAEILNVIGMTQDDVLKQFVYVDNGGKVHRASTAALEVAKKMTWPWPACHVFIVVPQCLRDAVYDVVAKYRYNMFGRTNDCQVPSKEIRDRFL